MSAAEARRSEVAAEAADPAIPLAPTRWLPPQLFLLYGLAGVVFHFAVRGPLVLRLRWPGGALLVIGAALTLWGAHTVLHSGTTILPYRRTTALVERGPFRLTRNPMYLGMVVMLLGSALALGTVGPWFVAVALLATLQWRFVRHEERALEYALGAPYRAYKRRVRRWL